MKSLSTLTSSSLFALSVAYCPVAAAQEIAPAPDAPPVEAAEAAPADAAPAPQPSAVSEKEAEPKSEETGDVAETEEAATERPPAPAGRGGFAVFPVDGTNLTEGESEALGVLFSTEIRDREGGRLISSDKSGSYLLTGDDQADAAAYLGVDKYLFVKAVRLDKTIIITGTLHNADGSIAETAKMNAKSVDDFEHIAERMTRMLLDGTSAKDTRNLNNITSDEGSGNNKTFVEKVFGFKTSFIVPYSPDLDLDSMVAASFDGRLEGDRYFLEFGAGFMIPAVDSFEDSSSYGGVFGEIGGSYYLTQTSVAPYVGAGVMPRLLSHGPANIAAYGQVGVMFFRTSSSRLYVEARVAQNLTELSFNNLIDLDTGEFEDTSVTVRPIEFGLNVGLGW